MQVLGLDPSPLPIEEGLELLTSLHALHVAATALDRVEAITELPDRNIEVLAGDEPSPVAIAPLVPGISANALDFMIPNDLCHLYEPMSLSEVCEADQADQA
jgi:hypothetical protein